MKLYLIACAAACLALSASAEDAASSRGSELLLPFKQQLKQALVSGISKGPDHAIAVCHDEAPKIAAAQGHDGVEMGRASDRLRNPANQTPTWAAPILKDYLENPTDRVPLTGEIGANRQGYVEPIIVQPLCLNCHGANVAPDIASRIDSLYPEDQAVGYEAGDLRGIFWVEYPASTASSESN